MANHFWCAIFLAGGMAATSPSMIARPSGTEAADIRVMDAGKVTGVAVTIFNDKKVVYSQAFGLRDAEKHLSLTPDSVMIAASLTKSIFAYMVMQLVEERVIDLDKPV